MTTRANGARLADMLDQLGPLEDDTSEPPCPVRPADLPDHRLRLMEMWKPGGVFERLVELVGSIGTESYSDHQKLADAELYWVSSDTCATVWSAYDSYPEDTILHESFLPAPCGFTVFAEPFIGRDAKTAEPIRVDAICWGPVNLKSRVSDQKAAGYSITSYRWMTDPNGFVVLGRSDWLLGRRLDAHSFDDDPITEMGLQSVIEDRKVLATLCSLVENPRVIRNDVARHSRQVRRRHEREATKAGVDPDKVRVHTLHVRGEGEGGLDDNGEAGKDYRHRWIVRPHWRQQPYGPGRKLRRPQLIPPHVKGPEGAPLLNPKNRVTRL